MNTVECAHIYPHILLQLSPYFPEHVYLLSSYLSFFNNPLSTISAAHIYMDVCCHPLHYRKPSSGHSLKKEWFFFSHQTTTHCQQFLGKWCKLDITYPIYAEIFHDMIFCRFDRSPQLLWVYGFDKMVGFLKTSFAMSSIISLWITDELSMTVACIPWSLE